jgi:hypothetical protein
MELSIDMITADGYGLQFGTNVISHWLFTELLMPAMFAASSLTARSRSFMRVQHQRRLP